MTRRVDRQQAPANHAKKAKKRGVEGAFFAFFANFAAPSFSSRPAPGVTVEDVLDVFGGQIVEATGRPIPAAHVPLYALARAHGFPWLRLRPGLAIGRGDDAWHAWLEGWVSPAELVVATDRLVRGEGLA